MRLKGSVTSAGRGHDSIQAGLSGRRRCGSGQMGEGRFLDAFIQIGAQACCHPWALGLFYRRSLS